MQTWNSFSSSPWPSLRPLPPPSRPRPPLPRLPLPLGSSQASSSGSANSSAAAALTATCERRACFMHIHVDHGRVEESPVHKPKPV